MDLIGKKRTAITGAGIKIFEVQPRHQVGAVFIAGNLFAASVKFTLAGINTSRASRLFCCLLHIFQVAGLRRPSLLYPIQ